jgi:excisionase family DNA binding protein
MTGRAPKTPARSSSGLHTSGRLEVPPETFEALAQRAAEIVAEREVPEPWIGVDEATGHLACAKSRIYALVSAGRIPHVKDGSRLLFRRSDLDRWLAEGGGKRP